MQGEFVEPESSQWVDCLAHIRHDVYHLPEYLQFAARMQEAGQPLAFVAYEAGRWFFLPILVRPIPLAGSGPETTLFDATSPRGYGGPLIGPPEDPASAEFTRRAIEAFTEACHDRRIVSAFIRLHPLLSPAADTLTHAGPVVQHGHSVSIDLDRSLDELWLQTRENHRRHITKAVRLGYMARIDDEWSAMQAFVSAYEESMERLGADAFWRLSRTYFDELRESLDGRIHLCVAEVAGEVAAAALLTEVDGIVEYHLAGTADAHVLASPSKLIIDFARRWAKERGNRLLHLGGSLRPDDSLSHFKAGFSPDQHPVSSWRIIVDPPAYRTLSAHWESRERMSADAPGGYFPAYRKPGSPPA